MASDDIKARLDVTRNSLRTVSRLSEDVSSADDLPHGFSRSHHSVGLLLEIFQGLDSQLRMGNVRSDGRRLNALVTRGMTMAQQLEHIFRVVGSPDQGGMSRLSRYEDAVPTPAINGVEVTLKGLLELAKQLAGVAEGTATNDLGKRLSEAIREVSKIVPNDPNRGYNIHGDMFHSSGTGDINVNKSKGQYNAGHMTFGNQAGLGLG